MKDSQSIYQQLADHLDHLPGGYPQTPTGVEIKILEKLFTVDEASLACHLTLLDENPTVVAYRSGLPPHKVKHMLAQMAEKGLIFESFDHDRFPMYMAAQFVVGIWEMQVGRLDEELVKLVGEYIPLLMNKETWKQIPQLRTIPVEQSIETGLNVLPYENARKLLQTKENFVVSPCICRKEKGIAGEACTKPVETCITFGTPEEYYISSGSGRKATLEEVLDILTLAEKKGLVLQPNNGQEIKWICCCCGCCCGVLRVIKTHPKPVELVSSPFIAMVTSSECDGCGLCVKRCQMDALTVEENIVSLDPDRCIGCGLCVSRCPSQTLTLVRKPASELSTVPKDIIQASIDTLRIRKKASYLDLGLMILKSKKDRLLSSLFR